MVAVQRKRTSRGLTHAFWVLIAAVATRGEKAEAQVSLTPPNPIVTDIVPDTVPTLETVTTVTHNGAEHLIDGGKAVGANLFHSFAQFNLGSGETAKWVRGAGDAASFKYVINRVTGGTPSFIDGTLDTSTFSKADFYFLNPAGMFFGPHAALNLGGSFYASTAKTMTFEDGAVFAATADGQSTLTSAPPQGFGFLSDFAGDIEINGAQLQQVTAGNLGFSADNIRMASASFGAGNGGTVLVKAAGDLSLQEGSLVTSTAGSQSKGAGSVQLTAGGVLSMKDSAVLTTNASTKVEEKDPEGRVIAASTISLIGKSVTISGGVAGADKILRSVGADTSGAQSAGSVSIASTGGDIKIQDKAFINSSAKGMGATGAAGSLTLSSAAGFFLTGNSILLSAADKLSKGAGSISVLANGEIGISGDGIGDSTTISTDNNSTVSGDSVGARIDLRSLASNITIDNAKVHADSNGAQEAGRITINGINIDLMRAVVSSSTQGDANAGGVFIGAPLGQEFQTGAFVPAARMVTLTRSQVSSTSNAKGDAGAVTIGATYKLSIAGSDVTSASNGTGGAGAVRLQGGGNSDLQIKATETGATAARQGSFISADTIAKGGGSVTLDGFASILVSSSPAEKLDKLRINVARATAKEKQAAQDALDAATSRITATSSGTAAAGSVIVNARNIILIDAKITSESLSRDPDAGAAGAVNITGYGDGEFAAIGGSRISVSINGGDRNTMSANLAINKFDKITLISEEEAFQDALYLARLKALTSNTLEELTGDTLAQKQERIAVQRAAATVAEGATSFNVENAAYDALNAGPRVTSTTENGGARGGNIELLGKSITLRGNAWITAETNHLNGSAGSVTVGNGDTLNVSVDEHSVVSSKTSGLGDAGSVTLRAKDVTVGRGAVITSQSTISDPGNAGDQVAAGSVTILGTGGGLLSITDALVSTDINSGAKSTTPSSISIFGFKNAAISNSVLSSATHGAASAGNVGVSGVESLSLDSSTLSSDTTSTGDAGSVVVGAQDVTLKGATLSSTSTLQDANAGRAGAITLFGEGDGAALHMQGGSRIEATIAGGKTTFLADGGTVDEGKSTAQATVTVRDFASARIGIDADQIAARKSDLDAAKASGNVNAIAAAQAALDVAQQAPVINTKTSGGARAGSVSISAENVTLSGATLQSDTSASGKAGDVLVAGAKRTTLENGTLISSSTSSKSADAGTAGFVQVSGREAVNITDSSLRSSTTGKGAANFIRVGRDSSAQGVFTRSVTLRDSELRSKAEIGSSGAAGAVSVQATEKMTIAGSTLTSKSDGTGAAGDVTLSGTLIDLDISASDKSGSVIEATVGANVLKENGGKGQVVLDGFKTISVAGGATADKISKITTSTAGAADAGRVIFGGTPDSITLSNAEISSSTSGSGAAASISIAVSKLFKALAGSKVSSETSGGGDANSVTIEAPDILLDASEASSSSEGPDATGAAGSVLLWGPGAPNVTLKNGAEASSRTSGAGRAGDVIVVANKVSLHGSVLTTESTSKTADAGAAGSITVTGVGDGASLSADGGAVISATSAGGKGSASVGVVRIGHFKTVSLTSDAAIVAALWKQLEAARASNDTEAISAAQAALDAVQTRVTTSTSGPAPGGNIDIGGSSDKSMTLNLIASRIESSSSSAAMAGGISVHGFDVMLDGIGSRIASENTGTVGGAAGSITVNVDPIELLNGARITTNSKTGAAGKITLILAADGVLRLESPDYRYLSTITTSGLLGGDIYIGSLPEKSSFFLFFSNGGLVQALGGNKGRATIAPQYYIRSADRPNTVQVDGVLVLDGSNQDVSQGTTTPDIHFVDPSRILQGQCLAVQQSGETSQLALRNLGPYGATTDTNRFALSEHGTFSCSRF